MKRSRHNSLRVLFHIETTVNIPTYLPSRNYYTGINKPPGCNEVSRAVTWFFRFLFWVLKTARLWAKARKVANSAISLVMNLERRLLLSRGPGKLVPECGCLILFPCWFLAPLQRGWELRASSIHLHNTHCHYIIKWGLANAFVKQGDLFNIPTLLSTYCILSKCSVLAKLAKSPKVLFLLLSYNMGIRI